MKLNHIEVAYVFTKHRLGMSSHCLLGTQQHAYPSLDIMSFSFQIVKEQTSYTSRVEAFRFLLPKKAIKLNVNLQTLIFIASFLSLADTA